MMYVYCYQCDYAILESEIENYKYNFLENSIFCCDACYNEYAGVSEEHSK